MSDLPDPLVPAEVDLRDFAFTPIYRGRLFGSAFHARVSDAAWRAGVTLWFKSWDQVPAGSLPDDEVDLCRLAELGRDVKTWRRIAKEALWGWFRCSDDRLYHRVVAEGVTEAWERKKAQRDRTAKARASRLSQRSPPSVTETATGSVTGSKGQGQGQGQLRDSPGRTETETSRPPPTDLERRCRIAVGEEPCLVDPNFGPILALLDDPTITEADVLAGIAAALAKADPGFRFRHWRQFVNWIRGAAKDRLGSSTRARATPVEVGSTVYLPGVGDIAELVFLERFEAWHRGEAWPERWGVPPDGPGTWVEARYRGPRRRDRVEAAE